MMCADMHMVHVWQSTCFYILDSQCSMPEGLLVPKTLKFPYSLSAHCSLLWRPLSVSLLLRLGYVPHFLETSSTYYWSTQWPAMFRERKCLSPKQWSLGYPVRRGFSDGIVTVSCHLLFPGDPRLPFLWKQLARLEMYYLIFDFSIFHYR